MVLEDDVPFKETCSPGGFHVRGHEGSLPYAKKKEERQVLKEKAPSGRQKKTHARPLGPCEGGHRKSENESCGTRWRDLGAQFGGLNGEDMRTCMCGALVHPADKNWSQTCAENERPLSIWSVVDLLAGFLGGMLTNLPSFDPLRLPFSAFPPSSDFGWEHP